MYATSDTNIDRAIACAADCAAYEAAHPGSSGRFRRSGAPPAAVSALAAQHGVSQELVRKLRNIATRVPQDLLDALRPHRPGLELLDALGRLSEPRQRVVVEAVERGVKLGRALQNEGA